MGIINDDSLIGRGENGEASDPLSQIPLDNVITQDGLRLRSDFIGNVSRCINEIAYHQNSLTIKQGYYDAKFMVLNIGIAIPEYLATLEETVGWAAKAVDSLTARSRISGFDGDGSDEVSALIREAGFDYLSLITDECSLGCAFVVVSGGLKGEPDVVITPHSPMTATALLSKRTRRPIFGITLHKIEGGVPEIINAYTPNYNVVLSLNKAGDGYRADFANNGLGVTQIVDFAHRRSTKRPLGRSRINPAVRSICGNAVREMLRSEIAAEFFTSPQKFLVGASKEALEQIKEYRQHIGEIFAASADKNGNVPTFGQLSQGSMEPHVAYMRQLAAEFAAETGVPLNSLGVVQDNPSSAEAIQSAREDIISEADLLNKSNTWSMIRMCDLVAKIGGINHDSITPAWASTSYMTQASSADAAIKMAQAVPQLAGTTVLLRRLGFTDEEIRLIKDENRKNINTQLLSEAITNAATAGVNPSIQPSAAIGG